MFTEKVILTPKQEAWLVRHFKHTKNDEICAKLGITPSTMHRYARRLGLRKTPQFMRKVQANAAAKAKASHIKHGTYPPKGYVIPRSEEFYFRPGVTPVERLGKRKNAQRIQRAADSRRKTYRYEKARRTFGVPQKTKLRVFQQPKKRIEDRWYLKKRGYIIDDQNFVAYWTPDTRRSRILESKPKRYYSFLPLP